MMSRKQVTDDESSFARLFRMKCMDDCMSNKLLGKDGTEQRIVGASSKVNKIEKDMEHAGLYSPLQAMVH